jgi:hypothetical protein
MGQVSNSGTGIFATGMTSISPSHLRMTKYENQVERERGPLSA